MLQFMPSSVWNPRRRDSGRTLLKAGQSLVVADTIDGDLTDQLGNDEREVVSQLSWQPQSFTATVGAEGEAEACIYFPSPKPQGNARWDTVVLDGHFARDRVGQIITAPAVIVLDILQGGNRVSGYIARTLAKNGLHAFVLHLPQNGKRAAAGETHDWNYFLPSLKQGASDARRARDVVASLPMVSGGVSLQGTSLGGFVATMAGAIDSAFDTNILALTGGDVFGVLNTGKMDAARVRKCLRDVGYTDDKLQHWLWQIEPLRIAHRLDAKKTWLFSARYDQVVSAAYGKKLAAAIGLDWSHHRHLTGCHYSCAVNAHRFLQEMKNAIHRSVRFSDNSLTAEAVSPVSVPRISCTVRLP